MFNLSVTFALLFEAVAIMTMIVFAMSVVMARVPDRAAQKWAMGLIMGLIACIVQIVPMEFADGAIVDARGLIVGGAAAFFGWRGAIPAVTLAALMRAYVGGMGAASGIVGILIAGLAALVWRILHGGRDGHRMAWLLLLGAMISLNLVTPMLFLPAQWRWPFYHQIGGPLVLAQVVGAVIFGVLIRHERSLQQLRRNLSEMAMTDPLTGLANRRRLTDLHAARAQGGDGAALIYIDIDHFKQINDRHGHETGDNVLRAVAGRLVRHLRVDATLARIGGEEFAALLPGATPAQARACAERLRRCMADAKVSVPGRRLPVTISVGLHCSPDPAPFESLLRQADQALYAAKQQGRNRVISTRDAAARKPAPAGAAA